MTGVNAFLGAAKGRLLPAALHLVTLAVLVMTAIATSLQLLPVASRQTLVPSHWPTTWSGWPSPSVWRRCAPAWPLRCQPC